MTAGPPFGPEFDDDVPLGIRGGGHVRTSEVDGLRVATVGEATSRDGTSARQVLAFMGIDAFVEPFELQRFSLLAALWDAQLTIVDAPGCGAGGGRLTSAQRRGLYRGDFTRVARRMVHSAQAHHAPLRRGSVSVVGYSMGASIAAAAAADPGLMRVSSLVLVEPVGMRRWGLVTLARSLRSERQFADQYVENNAAYCAVLPTAKRGDTAPHRHRTDLARLGLGVTRGRMAVDLVRAKSIQDFDVQVVHGTQSRLAPVDDVTSFVARCKRGGVGVRDVPVRGHHALWHSLSDVATLARLTRGQLGD